MECECGTKLFDGDQVETETKKADDPMNTGMLQQTVIARIFRCPKCFNIIKVKPE